MRTLVIVLVLTGIALAAGASFIMRAGAQQPTATLSYACDPASVTPGVDTLRRCHARATNTGSVPLTGVRLTFAGANNVPIPARYYFFGARLDGVPFDVQGGDIDFPIGDIAPGEQRTLDLDVIVRVGEPSGAIARLYLAGDDGAGLAQQLVTIEPDASAPPGAALRVRMTPVPGDPRRYEALLTVTSPQAFDDFTADVGAWEGITVDRAFWRQERMLGEDVFGTNKFHLTLARFDPPNPPGAEQSIAFEIDTAYPCGGGLIAVVGYLHAPDGQVARPALLAELPVPEGCADAGGTAVTSLGRGGFGPEQPQLGSLASLVAMIAGIAGCATVALGIYVVR
jgi:hypothetical protein